MRAGALGVPGVECRPGQRLITRPAWWAADVAIVLLYLPWLPSLLDLVQHVDQLKVGGDIGWEEPVNLLSLPSMIWQFLLQDDGLGLWPPLFWLFPLLLVAVVVVTAWRDRDAIDRRACWRCSSCCRCCWSTPCRLFHRCLSSVISRCTPWALPILLALAIDRLCLAGCGGVCAVCRRGVGGAEEQLRCG